MVKISRISTGPVGDKIWWFGVYARIRKVPAGYSSSGVTEYWVEFFPTDQIFRSRLVRCDSWKAARRVMARPIDSQG